MRSAAALFAAFLMLWPASLGAHEVPDRVDIAVLLQPEPGRMRILARVPANALIDFLLPTQEGGNWVDLANADQITRDAARVWIADLVSLSENGHALPTPDLVTFRLSRVNDPSFASFDAALARINGPPLSLEALVLQEQVTVDALLEVPIASTSSDFSFTPRFARLGVLVYTTLTYLPQDGSLRRFYYEGDPPAFALNPTAGATASRFFRSGISHYFDDSEYLLFALCIALLSMTLGPLTGFCAALTAASLLSLLVVRVVVPPAPWVPVLCGALTAAATVYAGVEAIVAARGRRVALAAGAGALFGAAYWAALEPIVQFGGSHALAATVAFALGVVVSQVVVLALATRAARLLLPLSRVPRAVVIIGAAVAIHVSWRRMLDRVDALTLVGTPMSDGQIVWWAAATAVFIALAGLAQRGATPELRQAGVPGASRPAE